MNELGFWKIAELVPERLAVAESSGREITYGELLKECNKLAHGFRAMGMNRGDTIALLMDNSIPFIEIMMAAFQIGIYVVPINWHMAAQNIAYIARDSEAKLLVASERFAENATKAATEIGLAADMLFTTGGVPGFQPYESIKNGQPETKPDHRWIGKVKTYTSGTTGRPKGVHRQLQEGDPDEISAMTAMFLMLFGIEPHQDNVHLVAAPLFHTAPNHWANNSLQCGHTLVLMSKWTPEETLQLVEKYRVTTTHMVPTMFNRLDRLPEKVKSAADLSSLRHVIHAAAPCPVELKQRMLDWWGPVIYEYYSASEGGGTLVTPDEWVKKPGTVGKPWIISEVKILDDNKKELPSGEIGSIYMKMNAGQNFEYHHDKSKTNKAYVGDFFTVDDVGYMDKDGYLFLTDRKSYMIIVGGVNIYPTEIENLLSMHPKIADNAVFGIPNPDLGEEIKAVVQLEDGIEPSEQLVEEIKIYIGEKLGRYRTPHSVDFLDKLPREATGKLIKRRLRDPYWEKQGKLI